MAYQAVPPYSGTATTPYSDWTTRAGSYLVDIGPVVIGWIVFLILAVLVGNAFFTALLYLILIAGSVAWGVYNRWILGGQGQTLGKKQLNIMLVSEETGQPIGTWRAFLRDLCHVYDGYFLFGYLLPLWDPKHQTQADKIMKTIVVPANQ